MTLRRIAASAIRSLRPVRAALFPPACRFLPTCSRYAEQAVLAHGLAAVWLVLARLARCHPFHPGGYDPVRVPAQNG